MNNICKGKLKHWNDEKGFGFILSENQSLDVFVHISALKNRSRRPVVGDIIYYQIYTNKDGKNKAINARIEDVTPIKPYLKAIRRSQPNNKILSILIGSVIILVLGLGYISIIIYYTVTKKPNLENTDLSIDVNPVRVSIPKKKEYSKYSCDGRVWCSNMTSCTEAKFFIRNCPGTKMDGDGDGIPCESQWCNN